jgi:hypothetical protein
MIIEQQDVPSLCSGIGGNVENSDEVASHSTNNIHSNYRATQHPLCSGFGVVRRF